jgi:ribosomal protein L3
MRRLSDNKRSLHRLHGEVAQPIRAQVFMSATKPMAAKFGSERRIRANLNSMLLGHYEPYFTRVSNENFMKYIKKRVHQ